MIIYNIKSFIGGKSDYNDKGIAGSGKWLSACEIRSDSDGLKCKQALKQEGIGVFEDLVLWFVPSPDGNIYGFGDTGKIYKRTSAGEWSKVYTEPDGKIKGAALSYRYVSTLNYQPYIFWATDTKLHRKEIPGQSDWTDVDAAGTGTGETYPKSNLTQADWHQMKVAQQFLLIANANLLAGIGIEDGSYSNEVNGVPLPPSLEITCLTNRGNNEIAAMCTAKNIDETACLYSIDMTSVDWLSRTDMSFDKIEAAIDGEFFLMVANGRLWYTDLYNKLPICDLPNGSTVKPSGVTLRDNVALFAIGGATRESGDQTITANGIYGYGRNKNAGVPVLDLEYPIICSEMGGMINNGNLLLVSCKVVNSDNTVTYKVMTIDNDNKQICEYESLELKNPYVQFPNRQRVEKIILKTVPIPQGSKIDVFYRLDLSGEWTQAEFLSTMGSQSSDKDFVSGNEATYLVGSYANYFEVKLRLTPSGNNSPEVKDIFIEVASDDDET